MENSYKLVITYGETYREAELPNEDISMRIGSTVRCDIRIAYELGKEPFEMELSRQDGVWTLECHDDVYFTTGGVRKQIRKQLEHDDTLIVILGSTNAEICKICFLLDFDRVEKKYDRVINIRGERSIVIGGIPNASIYIKNDLIGTDSITLVQRQGKTFLTDQNSRYGAYVNGIRVNGEREIRDTDFFSLGEYSFFYLNGYLYTDSRNSFAVNKLKSTNSGIISNSSNYPRFVRNVRKRIVLETEPITVLDPPQKPNKPKSNIFLQILPALASIILVVVLRGIIGGGGAFVIFSACTMCIGIITTTITFITGNKDYKKDTEDREHEYADYIERKRKEIESARQLERQQLAKIYWSPQTEIKRIRDFSGELFDRQQDDEDFLRICIGNGAMPASRPIKITEKESITVSDELAKIPASLQKEYHVIRDAPIYVDAINDNAIGVVGDTDRLYEMMKLMTLDLCARQYYSDVHFVYILGSKYADRASWVRWLPHVKNDALGTRNIVCDDESRSAIFEYLFVEMTNRTQAKVKQPHYVVFVMDDNGIKSHPMSKFFDIAKDIGFTFIYFEAKQELLPQDCDEVITLERGTGKGKMFQVSNINQSVGFSYRPISDIEIEKIALLLSPVYSEEVSLEGSLTKSISLYEMLGIMSAEDIDFGSNWGRAAVHASLAAPLGVKSGNETVYLDLHEKAHGSHALVAGTTGSGKSEILQSYILSMAILYHPYEISFLLIDFKGGGMANQFRKLPHLQGAITNIDGRELQRSLKSIRAELLKRQRLLAEADAPNISEYNKLYKKKAVSTPMPHLIIIVDEFAELKAQQPEFMAELISAFRIGRSLGVHLILATQKPAGQVNEQMWANARTKLCLKVNDQQDSNEMIKSPLAAEIREPGRAYMLVGNNEIFELFQSAFSGAPANISAAMYDKEFTLSSVSLFGKRQIVYQQKNRNTADNSRTQLDAIVDQIREYCDERHIADLPDVCMPALPEILPYVQTEKTTGTDILVNIGIFDDPENQMQAPQELNLTSENVIVIGSAQSGKTNFLQVLIRGLAEQYSPKVLTMYIIDFNSMILNNFSNLKHVGGVVTMGQDEAIKNLFKLLQGEIGSRKEKLLSVGVSSFSSYLEAGMKDLPKIVLIIDNVTALKEMYLQDDDVLFNICRDGGAVGISVVATCSQTSGIGYRYLSNFSTRIAFFCNDSGEYSTLFEYCRVQLQNRPGVCLIQKEKRLLECQTYLAFQGEKEIDRVHAMRTACDELNAHYKDLGSVAKIPVIPKVLTKALIENNAEWTRGDYIVPVGLDYADISPVVFNMTELGILGISGRRGMGRKSFVTYLLSELNTNRKSAPVSVVIFDTPEKRFGDVQGLEIVSKYSLLADEAVDVVNEWNEILARRYEMLAEGDLDALQNEPLLLMIAQNNDVAMMISGDPDALAKYKNFFSRYKALKICVIYSGMENTAIPYSAPEAIKPLRDSHHFMFFDDMSALRLFDPPVASLRQFKKEITPGDCYYTRENAVKKVRCVLQK